MVSRAEYRHKGNKQVQNERGYVDIDFSINLALLIWVWYHPTHDNDGV